MTTPAKRMLPFSERTKALCHESTCWPLATLFNKVANSLSLRVGSTHPTKHQAPLPCEVMASVQGMPCPDYVRSFVYMAWDVHIHLYGSPYNRSWALTSLDDMSALLIVPSPATFSALLPLILLVDDMAKCAQGIIQWSCSWLTCFFSSLSSALYIFLHNLEESPLDRPGHGICHGDKICFIVCYLVDGSTFSC